ncbi:MAG TPA: hypothetical protein VGO46_01500 [Gemmatimonadaceae bacterium]|jgi:hypothetical protein|nr:hypothetical protein [Gemmatimonadaceae bacterium]
MMNASEEELQVRRLRDAVATLEIPALRDDIFTTIADRRARGERVVLIVADAPMVRQLAKRHIIVVALAAVAALAIAAVVLRRGATAAERSAFDGDSLASIDSACANTPATARDSSALRHLMISAFGVPAACGAEPGQDPPIAYVPSQIRTGMFTYSSQSITDGVFTSRHGSSAVTISRTTWKGVPAFLAVRDGPIITGVHLDSLVVSADGLAPLYWASTYYTQHPRGVIRAEFDSTSIAITRTGRIDTAAVLPFRMKSGQLPFGFALPLAIPALPLALGWHGTVEVAPPIEPRATRYFRRPSETIRLRVIGREKVRVGAGVFDCWKLRVGEPESDAYLWVSTSNHLVIRSASVSRFGDTSFADRNDLESVNFDSP